jgi:hypothetical protein
VVYHGCIDEQLCDVALLLPTSNYGILNEPQKVCPQLLSCGFIIWHDSFIQRSYFSWVSLVCSGAGYFLYSDNSARASHCLNVEGFLARYLRGHLTSTPWKSVIDTNEQKP